MALPSSTKLLEFMNSVPTTTDFDELSDWLKSSLTALLGDVDRVSVGASFMLDADDGIQGEADPDIGISIAKFANRDREGPREDRTIKMTPTESRPTDLFVAQLKDLGYPIDRHQPPSGSDYYDADGAYLGTILLWRDLGNPPISEETRQLMQRLHPFLTYVLSNYVHRVRMARPAADTISRAIYEMIVRSGLSFQEQKIIWLRMYGHSYKEIASILSISVTTVKKHLNTIHRKTGTRSLAEIFGKYLAPIFMEQGSNGEAD